MTRSYYLSWKGWRTEALAELAKSRELDPGYSFDATEAATYYQVRDYQGLLEAGRKELASNPEEWLAHYFLGTGFEGLGRPAEAIPEYQKAIKISDGDQDAAAALAHAYAVAGRKNEAVKILRDLEQKSRTEYVSPYMIATIYAGLGDKQKAFEFLEKAYHERCWDLTWSLRSDLRIDNLRSDPRFQTLLQQVGLPR